MYMRANKCLLNSSQKSHIEKTIWGVDWIHVVQDRLTQSALVNTAMDIYFPDNAGNILNS